MAPTLPMSCLRRTIHRGLGLAASGQLPAVSERIRDPFVEQMDAVRTAQSAPLP